MLIAQGAIDACKIGVTIAIIYSSKRPQVGGGAAQIPNRAEGWGRQRGHHQAAPPPPPPPHAPRPRPPLRSPSHCAASTPPPCPPLARALKFDDHLTLDYLYC